MNVFDFDDTIYNGESGIHMFLFFLRKHPGLIRHAPTILHGFIRYKRGLVTQEQVMEGYSDIFHDFLRRVNLTEDLKAFWDEHERHLRRAFFKSYYRPGDLIISASPEQSLAEICGRLGAGRFIGTRVNLDTARFDFVCFRENKVKAFREQYPGEEIENFYTDSMNDKALMDIAKHVFMVGKKGKLQQIK